MSDGIMTIDEFKESRRMNEEIQAPNPSMKDRVKHYTEFDMQGIESLVVELRLASKLYCDHVEHTGAGSYQFYIGRMLKEIPERLDRHVAKLHRANSRLEILIGDQETDLQRGVAAVKELAVKVEEAKVREEAWRGKLKRAKKKESAS